MAFPELAYARLPEDIGEQEEKLYGWKKLPE
jgi:hypothetical protein